jgi:hypothetical protein
VCDHRLSVRQCIELGFEAWVSPHNAWSRTLCGDILPLTSCALYAGLQAVFVVAYFKQAFLQRHLRDHARAAAEVC